jgi:hypothetical protein
MSNYDFMMTTTYNEIKNQIIQLWMDYDKDGNMEDIIQEFKHYYGNDHNSIHYYDFEIDNIMGVQRFVIEHMENAGYDLLVSDMLSIATMEGLKRHLLYWVMEDIEFNVEEICEGCGDKMNVCENSSHPCYKCDGGCGKVMGSNDDCNRICEDCSTIISSN